MTGTLFVTFLVKLIAGASRKIYLIVDRLPAHEAAEDKQELRSNMQRFLQRLAKLPEHVRCYFRNPFGEYGVKTM